MDRDDGGIRAAMDGREPSSQPDAPTKAAPVRDPVAFFYVVFGLAYEALATSSTDTLVSGSTENQQRQALMLSALHALKSLVKPEYCGRALSDPTIFEEFLSLCYRLALTESPPVQSQLVAVIGRWALDHSRQSAVGGDVLSLTEPLAHVLRICAQVVKQTVSTRGMGSGALFTDFRLQKVEINAIRSIGKGRSFVYDFHNICRLARDDKSCNSAGRCPQYWNSPVLWCVSNYTKDQVPS